MSEEIAISVKNISKYFLLPHEKNHTIKGSLISVLKGKKNKSLERQKALTDISFDIKKGEFFGIVGRNGSGKSTLLKIIAGIYQPSEGSIRVEGRLVPFIELGVGFNPELTGRENVYLSASLMGFSKKEIDAMYKNIVDFAELEKFMDQKLKNYSSGMQVRLAFSIATRVEGDILLIDEVLAVGDADFQRKCFDYFKQLKKNKKTVIFVSHDMTAIREYCDRSVLIENSKLIESGTADEVATHYNRLFTDHEDIGKNFKSGDRWGEGSAITSTVKAEVNSDTVKITQEVQARKELTDLIIGFRIKGPDGSEITGTNTKIEKLKSGEFNPGQISQVEWVLPNIFSDGIYTIDTAIILRDGITTSDWWDGAAQFVVKKDRHLPYPVDTDLKLKIIKK